MRIASVGHAVFAAVLIAFGIVGLAAGDWSAVWQPIAWQPIPKDLPAHDVLVHVCAAVALASGAGLLARRTAAHAARLLLVYLVVWLAFRARDVVRFPGAFGAWDGCAEVFVMIAAALVLHAWLADAWDERHLGVTTGERGVRLARVFYGVAMIPFALAHFVYLKETAALVPSWIPAHLAWAYVTGGAFLAAGAAILVGVWARLAAALSALQIGLFTALVWIPIAAAGSTNAFVWSELGVSIALTAAAWVVADSYRGVAWRAVGKR